MSRLLPLLALLGAAVAVDWCAGLTLCCSVGPLAQTCLCPGDRTGERCRTGVAALERPGALGEGAGQLKPREAIVRRRRALFPGATERPRSTSDAAPGARPGLAAPPSPGARPASPAERPGDVLSGAASEPRGAWRGRRGKGAADGGNAERAELLVTAGPWGKARQRGSPSAAGPGTPAGRTDSPLFSTTATVPTWVPVSGTAPLGDTGAKDATSLGGSTSRPGSPTGFPGSGDRAPSSPSPAYPKGQSALPPGSSEPPGAALAWSEPPEEASQGRAVAAQEPVTAVTVESDLTDPGVGARPPEPTEALGPDPASGETPQPSPTPAARPEGWGSRAWRLGGGAASLARAAAETGGTPGRSPASRGTEPPATTAHPAPGDQTVAGVWRGAPPGTRGPGEGLAPTLAGAGSEPSPGLSGVPGSPAPSPVTGTQTEGDPRAASPAEPLAGASPARVPSASARTRRPPASLSAPAAAPGSAQPPPAAEQLSTWAAAPRPTAPAPEQPSSGSRTLAWLPAAPAERAGVPGAEEPRSAAASAPAGAGAGGPSSQPPLASTPGARRPCRAPAPGATRASQEGASPGASPAAPHSPGTARAPGPQPPPARPAWLPAPRQEGSTALSPTEPAPAPGPGPSPPAPSERDVPGSPSAPGLAELSAAAPRPPARCPPTAAATPAPSSAASWLGLGPQAATSPGNSSRAPGAPAPSGAGGSLSSSSWGAPLSPTAALPQPRLTAGSAGPPPAATPRAWSTDVTSRAGAGAPFASAQVGAATPPVTPGPRPPPTTAQRARGRAPSVFLVEDQPPLLTAAVVRVPCELALDMEFLGAFQTPSAPARRSLVQCFNQTVAPLFAAVPGFQRLEVTRIREGSVVLEYDALFAAERLPWPVQGLGGLLNRTLQPGAARPGLRVADARVLWNVALARRLDPCAVLFSCPAGFECLSRGDGNASCTSVCHGDYCQNQGLCTHPPDRAPACQCPAGSDVWVVGLRCEYRLARHSLLGLALGLLLGAGLAGAALACLLVRRGTALLPEARVDQTRSSYRRFCRFDEVAAPPWSQPWLAAAHSLDNPAFSDSQELLHLQMLDSSCCGCKDDALLPARCMPWPTPPGSTGCRPSCHYDWDTSSNSINDPMIDSGKASDISVASWPMEPIQWTPFPILHQLSRQVPPKTRRPHSYCEGTELVNLERSWTA